MKRTEIKDTVIKLRGDGLLLKDIAKKVGRSVGHISLILREHGMSKNTAICNVDGCDRYTYSKGMCRKHRALFLRTGRTETLKADDLFNRCKTPTCNRRTKKTYCAICTKKLQKGRNPHIDYRKGKNNVRWNNGAADYPMHGTMKRLRKEIIAKHGYKCMDCGEDQGTLHLHHIDETKYNHAEDNFKLLCPKCHAKRHKGRPNKCKLRSLYGASGSELAQQLGVSTTQIYKLHRTGKLNDYIERDSEKQLQLIA